MKSSAPTLLPLLRSRTQGDIIAWLMLHPDQPTSLAELAQRVLVSPATVMREVNRLSDAGLVIEERSGNQRLVRANTDTPVYRPLADLMAVTFGPIQVLGELLTTIRGVEDAFVYGSWAARYLGTPGAVPHDVDVLVVGTADTDDLDEAARAAEQRLGREVNLRQIRPTVWADTANQDAFLQSVRQRPMVRVASGASS